jgi:PAS domain S-box-containing protein/putative nucleotidyltransferase with HDIG domain
MLRRRGEGPKGERVSVRILFVEDSQDDVELQLRRLREAGLQPHWDRVQTEDGLRQALADESWQVALVDYNIPGFSGTAALHLIAELAPDLPAVTVSGAIDEDTAVATISAGAVDYVLKDNLIRLAPAVRRAVDGADLRRAHRRAAEAARLALFAVDHASLSIATVAEDGTVVYANDRACKDFFMDREALIGSKLWEVDERMQPDVWHSVWARASTEGALEFRMARDQPDGGRIVLDTTVNYLEGADLLITYGRDVTARVEAEEQARASEAEYRRMVEMASEGIWAMDGDYRTTFVNERMAQLLALTPADMLGRPVTDFMFDEDIGDHTARMSERREGQPGFYERRFRRSDGSELWTIVSAVASTDDAGEFAGSFAMFTDITERIAAETALAASEERFRRLAERVPGFVTIKDADQRYLYLSSLQGAKVSGGEEAWLGKLPGEVWFDDEAQQSRAAAERALAGEMVDELVRVGDDGRHLRSVHFPIPLEDGSALVGGLMLDVTAQVEAEEEVRRQAEQLRRTVEGAVLAMSQVVETRDPYTAGHERRVAELATVIGRDLGLTAAELDGLRLGALIHDIGKISVPAEILAKPGRLSDVEFNLIKQHSRAGYEILSVIDFGRPVAEMVLQHHERLDGSGYPQGLTAQDLLQETRILAVADVVEAMSSHRPYRAALGRDAALAEIRDGAGTRYDADVVAACERAMVEGGFRFSP